MTGGQRISDYGLKLVNALIHKSVALEVARGTKVPVNVFDIEAEYCESLRAVEMYIAGLEYARRDMIEASLSALAPKVVLKNIDKDWVKNLPIGITLEEINRVFVCETLRACGSLTKAANMLGIARHTVNARLKEATTKNMEQNS